MKHRHIDTILQLVQRRWRWGIYYIAYETAKDWIFGRISGSIEGKAGSMVDVLSIIIDNPAWFTGGLVGILILVFYWIERRRTLTDTASSSISALKDESLDSQREVPRTSGSSGPITNEHSHMSVEILETEVLSPESHELRERFDVTLGGQVLRLHIRFSAEHQRLFSWVRLGLGFTPISPIEFGAFRLDGTFTNDVFFEIPNWVSRDKDHNATLHVLGDLEWNEFPFILSLGN